MRTPTTTFIRQVLALGLAVALGIWLQLHFHLGDRLQPQLANPATRVGEREILYWWDPMMPEYKSSGPGKSPMGMDMVPVYADEASANQTGLISIAPEVVNSLGVRTAPVVSSKLEQHIHTSGFVDYDESKLTHVLAPVDGAIAALNVTQPGHMVTVGDPLLQIAPNGAPPNTVTSPVNGVVSEVEKIYNGMPVTTGGALMTIADPSTVWIKGEVFERDSVWLRVGQPVEARFPDRPGVVLKGTVEVIAPKVEYSSRTVRFRMRFDNPEIFLVPNMYAEISLVANTDEAVANIPREALIRDGHQERVVVALGGGRFTVREVVAGMEIGDRVEIRSGLAAGEQIVTSAQFLIDSEASLQTGLNRMEAPAESSSSAAPAPATGDSTDPHQHHLM